MYIYTYSGHTVEYRFLLLHLPSSSSFSIFLLHLPSPSSFSIFLLHLPSPSSSFPFSFRRDGCLYLQSGHPLSKMGKQIAQMGEYALAIVEETVDVCDHRRRLPLVLPTHHVPPLPAAVPFVAQKMPERAAASGHRRPTGGIFQLADRRSPVSRQDILSAPVGQEEEVGQGAVRV